MPDDFPQKGNCILLPTTNEGLNLNGHVIFQAVQIKHFFVNNISGFTGQATFIKQSVRVCVCVCVCERERERGMLRGNDNVIQSLKKYLVKLENVLMTLYNSAKTYLQTKLFLFKT